MGITIPDKFTRKGNTDHKGNLKPIERQFLYGTAGFRCNSSDLAFVVFRMGAMAGLRALSLQKTVGLMITASHNPIQDNGVKVIDPSGEMLSQRWELMATDIVNLSDEELPGVMEKLKADCMEREGKEKDVEAPERVQVFCAYDTRDSSQYLHSAARAGCHYVQVKFQSFGLLTTPQLHYIVRCQNEPDFGTASEEGYYKALASAYSFFNTKDCETKCYQNRVILDCANGVGAVKFRKLYEDFLPKDALEIVFVNETGQLNHECGADYVKLERRAPEQLRDVTDRGRCASMDGDADRLLYFYSIQEQSRFRLLDGDKMAVLLLTYLLRQMSAIGLLQDRFQIGAVQTAYANGRSTAYIRDQLKVNLRMVPTGVKHLHRAAAQFDVGVYFEANGHGTVLFSQRFKRFLREHSAEDERIHKLYNFTKLINETVGDAIADFLAIETILRDFDWSVVQWDQLYEDAPSCQIKVSVKDRHIFKPIWDETRLESPCQVQKQIDQIVARNGSGRAFVRPSGTEDVVRVYAEGSSEADAKSLARDIAQIIQNS